jgi:deoxyribose-phosphate aldolase
MNTSETKAFEAQRAIADGADELDMVINVAALKEGDYETVLTDIKGVCAATTKAPQEVLVKVILETSLLNDNEKVAGAILAKAGGAHFVKTSTGFGPGGATAKDVTLLRQTVGESLGVKAAGGIHDYDTAMVLIEAGASRIGASHSIDIIAGAPD